MAAGTAQINSLADFIQDKEDDMKTLKPYFEGEGFNLDYEIPMHPTGDEFDSYDYSKPVEYDYSNTAEQGGVPSYDITEEVVLPSEQTQIAQSPTVQYSVESLDRM